MNSYHQNRHQRSLFQNSNEDRKKREEATRLSMRNVSMAYMEEMHHNSLFFHKHNVKSNQIETNNEYDAAFESKANIMNWYGRIGLVVPQFEPREIELETTIGMGEFGVVLGVGNIQLDDPYASSHDARNEYFMSAIQSSLEGSSSSIHNADLQNQCSGDFNSIQSTSPEVATSCQSMSNDDLDDSTLRPTLGPSHHSRKATDPLGLSCAVNATFQFSDFPNDLDQKDAFFDTFEVNRHMRQDLVDTFFQRKLFFSTTLSRLPSCLKLSKRSSHNNTSRNDDPYKDSPSSTNPDFSQVRNGIMDFQSRKSQSLLVLKQIRKDLYPKKRIEAAKDLAREAKFLARLQQLFFIEQHCYSDQQCFDLQERCPHYKSLDNHPNLITLRGIVSSPGSPDFGILLDRLHLTLTEHATSWGKRQRSILKQVHSNLRLKNSYSRHWWWTLLFGRGDERIESQTAKESARRSIDSSSSTANAIDANELRLSSTEALVLLGERVLALLDVAEGMRHLHHHKILFRDLKSENVGETMVSSSALSNSDCDIDSDDASSVLERNPEYHRMQIFDFGLARECKDSDKILSSNPKADQFYDEYKMTGLTGTMRIMAPEVIQCLPYGLPADIYSYGICMWEVFTGKKCTFLAATEIFDAKQSIRPKLPVKFDSVTGSVGMPKQLQALMQQCWHENPICRPNFDDITDHLKVLLGLLHSHSSLHSKAHTDGKRGFHFSHPSFLSTRSLLSTRILPQKEGVRMSLSLSLRSCADGRNTRNELLGNEVSSPSNLDDTLPRDSSNPSKFWARLEAMHASGVLEDYHAYDEGTQ